MFGYHVFGSRDEEAVSPLVLRARYIAWSGSWRFFTGEALLSRSEESRIRQLPFPVMPISIPGDRNDEKEETDQQENQQVAKASATLESTRCRN
jgi:hypothetical protein